MSVAKVAVVTGATQGLGFALAEGLADQLSPADVVYLTGRDAGRVRTAIQGIENPRAQLRGEVLDVTDAVGVRRFAADLEELWGGVDIVFSNAAARLTPGTPPAELVMPFVETNNLGTTRVLREFDSLLRPGARLIVVASDFGSLRRLPAELHRQFDTDSMTLDDVDEVMLAWRDAVIEGRAGDEGWPGWINIPSKVGQVAAVRVAARQRSAAGPSAEQLVVAACPGLIDTAASRPWFDDMSAAQSPREAAVAPLRLALARAADRAFHGQLVQFGRVIPWR